MLGQIKQIIKVRNLFLLENSGVPLCKVPDQAAGFSLAAEILGKLVDKKTVLYLSGGSTPKKLYEKFTHDESLVPGAAAMIDERYGEKFHPKSNELMMQGTGLLRYLQILDIPFYPILTSAASREETAAQYDSRLRMLQSNYPMHTGILGIGADGHTAGIAGNRTGFTNPVFDQDRKNLFASEFDDKKSAFKERVTMTFLGLSMLDFLLVLVFGKEKKEALSKMFEKGSEQEIPARFYTRPEIAKKTLIITDQEIKI